MDETSEIEIKLTLGEINQILDALGSQPYRQVYQLIGKIQVQAESQLQQPRASVIKADQANGITPTTEFISK
jgi:hypothetical protein